MIKQLFDITFINAKAMMIYNSLKPYRMYVTVEEISALKNLEGQEFILQVYEFITQKQGLTEKSRPYFQLLHSMNNEFDMCYSPIYNIIWGDLSKLS